MWELLRKNCLTVYSWQSIEPSLRFQRWLKLDVPEKLTIGPGHVRFFYNKIAYLWVRYVRLYKECRRRGMKVKDTQAAFNGFQIGDGYWNNWKHTEEDRQMLIKHLKSRGFGFLLTI